MIDLFHCFPVAVVIVVFVLTAGCTNDPVGASNPTVSVLKTPLQYASVNGATLAYREFGEGEPLLIIIGFGATMDQISDTAVGILASKYHVYLYDHRGMGHSNGATNTTIAGYADDAIGLMTALDHERMHVYGTSMGSMIAQELALSHPHRVHKMILDSSTYSIRVPETRSLLEYVESVAADPTEPPGLRNEAIAMLAWNGTWDRLPNMTNDVMLVVGTDDTVTPDVLSARMALQINGSWLVRFHGLPYAGGDVAPVEYCENALYFLGRNTTRSR